ncbi:Serine protease precursor MucD/AlgY associated with sigma factor RpoE [Mucinivorans hirudinis]|uniref:Serine protease MucD/AlgY associated with sigma factor RpoE n=1 Tax=Mucinivorans hirudinis TaxID=1433126 RepID=A0A060RCZ9_9BACT|nr:Serine protease precursor MucD/AlgY associated with sigma factor RpoE [Mucinivorans hirudinis]
MRSLFIIIILCVILMSCERKSGRKFVNTKSQQTTQGSKTENSLRRNDASNTSSKEKKTLSGPEIFEKYNSAVFMIFTSDGVTSFQGSGFFVSGEGVAASNYHVFKGTTKGLENIKLTDGRVLKIKEVIGYDENLDYIIFSVDIGRKKVTYIPLCSSNSKVGDKAYAIGSPRGLENTFSSGEISQIRNENILQISVPIDHGSSGGALINQYGEAIGITTAGLDESGANLNFAMSISVLKKYRIF